MPSDLSIEMCEIVNTAQFRFPMGSPRPSWAEIANFLKSLEADLLLIESAYKTAKDRSLFLKFSSLEAMMETLKKNAGPKKFMYENGRSVEVRMCIAGANVQYVRVFDLPPELSDECLSLVLGEYGKIDQVVREKFPVESGLGHIYNGVRGVFIDVETEIPPAVDVGIWKGRIFHDGLKNTCFLCRAVGHRKDSCPQRGTRKDQAQQQRKVRETCSYAAIVSQGAVSPEQKSIPEDDIIEVLEDLPSDITTDAEQGQSIVCVPEDDSEWRPMTQMEKLEEVAKVIKEAMGNPTADQRRAQFAASGTSSGSGSRVRKKCARRTLY